MILITKPSEAPTCLSSKGAKQTKLDCESFDLCPGEYLSGRTRFTKKNGIYNAKQVKEALLRAQHNKCCYCESKYSAINLAVEHFRPKSGVRQARGDKEEHPGYYWLAYKWDNLLLSCHTCNSVYKRTLFPLANPHHRARSHHHDISLEQPLFVNPAQQDPRDHIRFDADAPVALTPIGRTTIEEIGLRSDYFLREERAKKLQELERLLQAVKCARKDPQDLESQALACEIQEFLDAAILPDAEYSSMAQDFILKWQA